MTTTALSAAAAEAYALAPSDVVVLHTLELRHPAFVDALGAPAAIRIVRDHADLLARLEVDGPLDAGEWVTFTATAFEFQLPDRAEGAVPELRIVLDGVSREIVTQLEAAQPVTDPIEVTYRPYLSSDLSTPHLLPPLTLTLSSVDVGLTQVSGRASGHDFFNLPFPRRIYRTSEWPGLVR